MNYKKFIALSLFAIPSTLDAMKPATSSDNATSSSSSSSSSKDLQKKLDKLKAEKELPQLSTTDRVFKFFSDYIFIPVKNRITAKNVLGVGVATAVLYKLSTTDKGKELIEGGRKKLDDGWQYAKANKGKTALIAAAAIGTGILAYKSYKSLTKKSEITQVQDWRDAFIEFYGNLSEEQKLLPFITDVYNNCRVSIINDLDSKFEDLNQSIFFKESLTDPQLKQFSKVHKLFLDEKYSWEEKFKILILSLSEEQMGIMSLKILIKRIAKLDGMTTPLSLENNNDFMRSLNDYQKTLFESIKYSFMSNLAKKDSSKDSKDKTKTLQNKKIEKDLLRIKNHLPEIATKWQKQYELFVSDLSKEQRELPYVNTLLSQANPFELQKHISFMDSIAKNEKQFEQFFDILHSYIIVNFNEDQLFIEFEKSLTLEQIKLAGLDVIKKQPVSIYENISNKKLLESLFDHQKMILSWLLDSIKLRTVALIKEAKNKQALQNLSQQSSSSKDGVKSKEESKEPISNK